MSDELSVEEEETEVKDIGTYEGGRNEKKERHGWGRAVLPNGDTYEGNYFNGKRHGFGTYRFRKNRARYAGNYIFNIRQGFGTMIYPDGSKYEGNWTDAKRNGYGKYYYVNGDVYDGEWRNNQRNGMGIYYHAETGTQYAGWWKKGRREGHAEVTFLNHKFIGRYKRNKPFGPGKFEFLNNSEAIGAFVLKEATEEEKEEESEEKEEEEEEEEEEMSSWSTKVPIWRTDMINDLHRQPPPTMQEQIATRSQVVKSEMLELDRQLILSLKPEEHEEEVPAENSLTDFFGSVARDVTSQLLEKLNLIEETKQMDEQEEEEEEDDACAPNESPINFTQREVDFISAQTTDKQPPAY